MVIYIDILIGLNLYITWLLLLATEKLSGIHPPLWRKAVATALGGSASLLILLPPLPELPLAILRLAIGAILAGVAFGFGGKKRFLRSFLWFYGANFFFAGSMILLWTLFQPRNLAIRNGVVYYHISSLTLILATIAAYGAVRAIAVISAKKLPQDSLQTAVLTVNGISLPIKIFYDSGNRLYSLSGLPVVVCSYRSLRQVLPTEIAAVFADPTALTELPPDWQRRIEMIPSSSVGGEKLLLAIRPDRFLFRNHPLPCLIALSDQTFLDGEADAIGGDAIFHTT